MYGYVFNYIFLEIKICCQIFPQESLKIIFLHLIMNFFRDTCPKGLNHNTTRNQYVFRAFWKWKTMY